MSLSDRLKQVIREETGEEPQEPELRKLGMAGDLLVVQQYFPTAGRWHKGHSHAVTHMSFCAQGSVTVYIEGKEPAEHKAPCFFEIPAELEHEIVALEDRTMCYCVFANADESEI